MISTMDQKTIRVNMIARLRERAQFSEEDELMVVLVSCVSCKTMYLESLAKAVDDVAGHGWHTCIKCDQASLM